MRRTLSPPGAWPVALPLLLPLVCLASCLAPPVESEETATPLPEYQEANSPLERLCQDGLDNDGDGATDCDDLACLYSGDTAGLCGRTPGSEASPEACNDGRDNDGDGHTDCDDYDCRWNALITTCDRDLDGSNPREGDCFDHPGLDLAKVISSQSPEQCGDGWDGDCDGAIDESDGCIELDLGWRRVLTAFDGDTLDIDGLGSVRLKGIDTPETYAGGSDGVECYGLEAKALTQDLTEGQWVRVLLDPTDEPTDFLDIYDRLLAHIELEDGTYLNGLLVQGGYACVWRSFDCYNKPELLGWEAAAQAGEVGLWGACGGEVCF